MFTKEEYANGNAIALSWHIDDVKVLDPTLSDEDARKVLKGFENNHDGAQGALWDDLQFHVDNFKQQPEDY